MNKISPSPIQSLPQEVNGDKSEETLCDLIKKICQAVVAFFAQLFCCRSANHDLPSDLSPERLDCVNSGTLQSNSNAQGPEKMAPEDDPSTLALQTGTPPSLVARPTTHEDLASRTNLAAVKALKQIANAYRGYLIDSAESFMSQHPEVFSPPTANHVEPINRLARPYLGAHFKPMNADMRYGDQEMARLCADMKYLGSWKEPEDAARKAHIAHLQEAINSSPDRIIENGTIKYLGKQDRTVYRNSYCPRDFVQNHLTSEKIKEGIFLANKSFLSTAASKMPFDPKATAFESSNPKGHLELSIQMQLLPNTPILDIDTRKLGDPDECEILLPAGRAFKVRSYNPETFNLDLEEVSPEAIYGMLYTTVL